MSNKQCQFSATQRAFVVTSYLKTNSIKQAQISYAKEYQLDRRNKKRETFLPGKTSIYRWVSDLKRHDPWKTKTHFQNFESQTVVDELLSALQRRLTLSDSLFKKLIRNQFGAEAFSLEYPGNRFEKY